MSLDAGVVSGSLKFDISDYTRAIAEAQSTSSIFPGIVSSSLDSPLQGFLGTLQKVKESLQGGLKLDTSEFTHAIMQAQSISSIFPGIVTNFLVNPLLGFIGTIKETGSALVGLAFRFSDLENHTRQLAESMGVSLQFLDGWGKAATLVGGSTEDVAGMMTHLSHAALTAATRGGEVEAAFKRLGVSVLDGGGHLKGVQTLLEEVSDGFQRMGAGAERTGTAMQVLGRGGASSLAFLSQGSTAIKEMVARLEDMGLVTSEATAASAKAFQELWAVVRLAWNGILEKIAEPVRIALMPILADVLNWMQSHPQEIQEAIQEMAHVITEAFGLVQIAVQFALEHFDTIIALMGAAGIGAAALIAVQALGMMANAFTSLIVQLDIATASQLAFNAAANGLKGAGIGGAIGLLQGTGTEGRIGGAIGGGIGGIAGGIVGGPVGALIGSAALGEAGTLIGNAFTSAVTINVTSPSGDSEDIAQTAADAASKDVFEKVKKHQKNKAAHQNVSHALKGAR